ncbi:hypothetical protein BCU50_010250 [Vibrio sp. 10N.286.46.E10]|uniref:hypothetical protein n=1 Tax=Vibrio sp. 10N.286.46.E10 TaxID=1884477 RepID=UPI000C81AD0D|nr:hypothetical protein [Vibrio sp. 10N.286.46.E10]PMI20518.1 hypothetical protein BCU50_17695 [Vibrio sp. 10N.286.46.E10]
MRTTLILLADLSYQVGIIGLNEHIERLRVAEELFESGELESVSVEEDPRKTHHSKNQNHEDELSFVGLGKWKFTPGDVDCFPSVPHGHLHVKTSSTRVNPYTGVVFDAKNKELSQMRLKKKEMVALWSDPKFRDYCRVEILWYSDFAPRYKFPNAKHGKMKLPRWRK